MLLVASEKNRAVQLPVKFAIILDAIIDNFFSAKILKSPIRKETF